MASKLKPSARKPPAAPSSGTVVGASNPKPAKSSWKTPEQEVYMETLMPDFLTHQSNGSVERFWPRVYEDWYTQWPITPTPQEIAEAGSASGAILIFRNENNKRIRTWFYNHSRPTARSVKSDLQLTKTEKRKLAPAQAYLSYAWDDGFKEVVEARWKEHKISNPNEKADQVTLAFKTRIAKEAYDSLSPEERKKVDDRREFDRSKLYQSIQDIKDIEERDNKLSTHLQNQPSVVKSLTRVLKNLEDQAGCVAQLLVGYIDPRDGSASYQNFCQGKTNDGLNFRQFCGEDWDNVIEKRFLEWGRGVYGELGSTERSMFIFSDASHDPQGATSSESTEGVITTLPRTGAAAVNEDEAVDVDTSAATPLPQLVEALQTVSAQISTPLVDDDTSTADSQSLHSSSGSPAPSEASDSTTFVPPNVGSPEAVGTIENGGFVVSAPVPQTPIVIPPPVLGSFQTVTSHQVTAPTGLLEVSRIVPPPVPDSLQVVTPNSLAAPVVHENPLVTPSEVTLSTTSSQTAGFPVIRDMPSIPSPPLVASQETTRQVQNSSAVCEPSAVSAHPQVPQPAHLHAPSSLVEGVTGGNLGIASASRGIYKILDKPNPAAATRSRRDSIEGAPDIILTLGESGYEHVTTSERPDISNAPPSTASISTTPSPTRSPSATPFDGLVVPSSQQSIEESLTLPAEFNTTLSTTSSTSIDTPALQPSIEGPSVLAKRVDLSIFAPRIIPNYLIDRSDFPSWLHDRDRLNAVLLVESGGLWEKLITTWLKQERRLAFGLDENIGASLSMKDKPEVLKDYFKWHHNPSRGDSIVLSQFAEQVSNWWYGLRSQSRRKSQLPTGNRDDNDYSFILAGGKKGAYLVILCLAWWDRSYGRYLEEAKDKRRAAARAAGKDDTTLDFDDLPVHDHRWFNILNDLIIVLERAQACPIPINGTSKNTTVVPRGRKRPTGEDGASPRKKKKSS